MGCGVWVPACAGTTPREDAVIAKCSGSSAGQIHSLRNRLNATGLLRQILSLSVVCGAFTARASDANRHRFSENTNACASRQSMSVHGNAGFTGLAKVPWRIVCSGRIGGLRVSVGVARED
jgi:hypothetical protein